MRGDAVDVGEVGDVGGDDTIYSEEIGVGETKIEEEFKGDEVGTGCGKGETLGRV